METKYDSKNPKDPKVITELGLLDLISPVLSQSAFEDPITRKLNKILKPFKRDFGEILCQKLSEEIRKVAVNKDGREHKLFIYLSLHLNTNVELLYFFFA